ncbi:bifunctional diguanylate cyclase/phosphodiesterase [Rhodoplanes sp. Z2-YC6860]|uniref:bifunctional diguanylate cyclase/phosphodiesterase n=1 Tax=Rhodoplanes sp. Z2-YC6860 TaxID=674703 RepID=UPI001F3D9936|nr:EAL domain-containing protein [Rhodoplanes sp. Z2-YC6860]
MSRGLMFRVFTCLAEQHDWRLVGLAGLVCFLASLVAVHIFHRAVASQARSRLIWIAIAGGAIGYGIWATHFIAMLAYDPGIVIGYGLPLTGLSLAAAMVLTSAGFGIAAGTGASRRGHAALGGAIVGAGIASMHYLGMWALEAPGRISWSIDLAASSVILGMLFGMAALMVAVRSAGMLQTLLAGVLLTLAIVSHHFTAMGAIELVPDPARTLSHLSLSPTLLAVAIAGVALTVLGMSFIGVLADRRLAVRTDKFQKIIQELKEARQQTEASQMKLEEQTFRLDMAVNNMSHGLLLFDSSERIVICNQRYIEMYRLSPDVVKAGCTLHDLLQHRRQTGTFTGDIDSYRSTLMADLAQQKITHTHAHLPDGRSIEITNKPLPDGGWLATHRDTTEQRRSQAKIAYMAHHDVLTGLANRAAVAQRIDEAAARHRRWGESFAILLLDLDRFKYVNDTLGHPAGDALLREVATRLKASLRKTDVLGRLGGDEFAIIQASALDQRGAAAAFGARIIDVLSRPFIIEGQEVNIGTSIGIALAPEHAKDPDGLLKMADLALYRAKSSGRGNYCFFDAEMMQAAGARRELETELRRAIQKGELTLYYQPIVSTRTRKICAAEALIRWQHPTRGTIEPGQFIGVAEETGLIAPIGEWALSKACAEAAQWPDDIKLAVNLSPIQFRKANLGEVVSTALARSGLSPSRLELEITETALIERASECVPLLRQFKTLGIAIALDDFGTGYSSLSQLTMFPFDKIKIDTSFIRSMTKRADCAAIISATLTLANSLNIATTAEGVETEDQYKLLRLAGVTALQGYLFKRPGPAGELDFDAVYGGARVEGTAA